MTDERMKEIRFKMWALAQGVMRDAANTRSVMPTLTDEEYEYARNFLLGIVRATQPGGYRELDDDEIEQAQTDYTRGVVDGNEININILSESTALLEEQRLLIESLRAELRARDDEFWCEQCQESIPESHYHCTKCGEVCSMAGHPQCGT
jgi:hypothetical protein